MTILEVVVAFAIFALIASGVAAGSMTITRITADSRAREVATNLAAQELDEARAVPDVADVVSNGAGTSLPADSQTVSGRVYTITRTASWVSTAGSDTRCGTNDNVQYRRVSVTVSWVGQLGTTRNITSATLIAPRTRYADATTGAISIRVTGVDGTPRAGVSVTIVPVTDGRALTSQPDPTDADGCAYATQVTPGTYSITLRKTGYIGSDQNETPSRQAPVAAGSTYGWPAEYDQAATFTTNYAANYTGPGSVQLPSTLDTTFLPVTTSYSIYPTANRAPSVKLYPLTGGYEAVAGSSADVNRTQTCASEDPVNWPATTMSGTPVSAVRAKATASVGGSATFATSGSQLSIPMGVVRVAAAPGALLTARAATPTGSGNPGCAAASSGSPPTYTYSGLVPVSGYAYIALPYGSWTVFAAGLPVPKASLTAVTNFNTGNAVTSSGGVVVVTLDPRVAQ